MAAIRGLLVTVAGCLFLIGDVTTGPSARSSCPPGWFFYKSHCYGINKIPSSWADAEFECVSYGHGAHLVSILDDSEASIIASHLTSLPDSGAAWLGLHDPEKNGRWKWTDGSMYNYQAWKSGLPDNSKGSEFCAVLTSGSKFKKWNDVACRGLRTSVCKFKP